MNSNSVYMKSNECPSRADDRQWFQILAAAPIPLFIAAMLVLRIVDLRTPHESQLLMSEVVPKNWTGV